MNIKVGGASLQVMLLGGRAVVSVWLLVGRVWIEEVPRTRLQGRAPSKERTGERQSTAPARLEFGKPPGADPRGEPHRTPVPVEAFRVLKVVLLGTGRRGRRGAAQAEIGRTTVVGRVAPIGLTVRMTSRTVALGVVRTGVAIRLGRVSTAWIEVIVSSSPR